MCNSVKKQLLNLYAAFGFIPTKYIALPGYKPEPPEVGSSSPTLEKAVRETNVTVVDSAGQEVTMSVADFIDYLYNAQQPTGGGSSIFISETPIADGEALKELTVVNGEGTTKTIPISEQKDGQVYIYIDDDGRNFALVVLSGHYSNIGSASLATKLDSSSAAPAFSTSSTYAVGEHVTYNGVLYRCTTAVTTPGAWDASKWTADSMTDPDAVLDVTAQNQLRVVAQDGTVLWAQGYDLASESSTTLACGRDNYYVFAATTVAAFDDTATYAVDARVTYGGTIYKCTTAVETAGAWTGSSNWTEDPDTQTFTLPTAASGKVGDFGLDVDNSANTVKANIAFGGTLGTDYDIIVREGESLTELLSVPAGKMAQFNFTLTAFGTAAKPAWRVMCDIVEREGAGS